MTVCILISRSGETNFNTLIAISNLPYLNMSLNFYLYFLSGKMFRNEFKRLMRRYFPCLVSPDQPLSTADLKLSHGVRTITTSCRENNL